MMCYGDFTDKERWSGKIGSVILLCILISSNLATAQSFEVAPSYVLDQWTVEDGLPVNSVVDVLQAKNGYIWLATFDGLVRFDGVHFEVYQREQYPGLPSNRILEIVESQDGSIWMLTEQAFLVQYKNGIFIRHDKETGLNGDLANDFYIDLDGRLWIAANEGISLYERGRLKLYRPEEVKGSIQNIFAEKNGAVWYKKSGEHKLIRRYLEELYVQDYIHSSKLQHLPIFQDSVTAKVWIGEGNRIHIFDGEKTYLKTILPDSKNASGFTRAPDGTIWVSDLATDTFVIEGEKVRQTFWKKDDHDYVMRNSSSVTFQDEERWLMHTNRIWKGSEQVFYYKDRIYSYLFDEEGSLWIGTGIDGLIRLKKNLFKTYGENEGLNYNNVYAIVEDYKQDIWVGSYRNGTNIISNGEVVDSVGIENTSYGGFITSLYMDKDSIIYAGSIDAGISWLNPGEKQFSKERNTGFETPITIRSFYDAGGDSMWLGTPFGLFTGKIGQWNKVEDRRFIDFRVRAIKEAPDGSLWLATNGAGIVHYYKGDFTFYGTEKGFTSNLIRSFHISETSDPGNYILWVGSEDLGLIRVEISNGTAVLDNLTRYGTQSGLLDYVIHSIQEDDHGFFWMNTNRGIYRIAKEQLEAFHLGEISELKGISFTESDGLRNREGNGGNQSAGIKDSKGNIWFASQAGVVTFNPSDFVDVENKEIPPVIIEDLSTDSRSMLINNAKEVGLTKEERNFEINFTSLSLVSPEKNEFRYRLIGLNDDWQESGGRRTAIYTNVPNGTYGFEVVASNNTGIWNPQPAKLIITVEPYFYETVWFRFSIILLLALGVAIGVRWRLDSLKKSEARLKEQVQERTKDLEEEKEKTERQATRLKELDEAKTRFFTNISHELRTPLTLIMSPLKEMLSSNSKKFDGETKQEFERMLRNSDRLLRLIDQTLELTRLERGKLSVKAQKLDLKKFIEGLIELFRYVALERNIELLCFVEEGDYELFADPDKLDKIIANLISNAVKFTPEGGKIEVSVIEKEDDLLLFVKDTGIGISEENIQKVFDRFYQVDDSETRFQEGSGIGLSLVKDFVELHYGRLEVESEIGSGSIFKIWFKKGKEHFSEEELSGSEEEIARETTTWVERSDENEVIQSDEDRTTVLVVEDNEDLQAFIQKILKDHYRVVTASDGEAGLAAVKSHLPDLIVADIMMPRLDGITFNQRLKENPETASVPLIFLTAKTTTENKIQGFEEGADDYLTKPFDPDVLRSRIKNLIESRYRLREHMSGQKADLKQVEQEDPFVQKVWGIIGEHYLDPEFTVSKLAELLFMDRSQVLRKLKELVGLSPSQFIKKYRMEKAAELLEQNSDNISEIAYATGFKSLSYFSYVFKEHYNMSPSEYMQNKD